MAQKSRSLTQASTKSRTTHPRRSEFAGARLPRGRRRAALPGARRRRLRLRCRRQLRTSTMLAPGALCCLAMRLPEVIEAIIDAARKGTSFGASTPIGDRPGRGRRRGVPVDREAALRQLRNRSHHVGHPPGARRHQAQIHRQVRRLLSRPQRCAAGEGRLRRRHARHSRLGRGAGRVRPVHPGAALQRSQGGRSSLRQAQGADRLHHRGAGRRQHGLRSAAARATWNSCARSPAAKARC